MDAALAEERRGGTFDPAKMPLTQLAMTAIDIVGKERETIAARLISSAESELLCHRADKDEALADLQEKTWQPLLLWCAGRFKASLHVGGLMPLSQPPEALAALRHALQAYNDFYFTGIDWAAGITGSLVLALALAERHVTAAEAFEAAELEALYQMKRWGEDPLALARHHGIFRDLEVCQKWFEALSKD
jgi:chaperone required for assembly of F1-ATPase